MNKEFKDAIRYTIIMTSIVAAVWLCVYQLCWAVAPLLGLNPIGYFEVALVMCVSGALKSAVRFLTGTPC